MDSHAGYTSGSELKPTVTALLVQNPYYCKRRSVPPPSSSSVAFRVRGFEPHREQDVFAFFLKLPMDWVELTWGPRCHAWCYRPLMTKSRRQTLHLRPRDSGSSLAP